MAEVKQRAGVIVLDEEDYRVLDEDDFGVPGLVAHEWVGPFVDLQAVGPLIMVHDGIFDPRKGITHHPHRYNERLFYIMEGTVHHDDSLNDIQGFMGTGDLGRLTEGRRGMLHQEWNNTDGRARAFILVYGTDPMPETASFDALRDADARRYEPAPGVTTKELVGPRSHLEIHGDVRLFTDDDMSPGSELSFEVPRGEGGMLFVAEGAVEMDGDSLKAEKIVLLPPARDPRTVTVVAPGEARLLRATFGPGHGLVLRSAGQHLG